MEKTANRYLEPISLTGRIPVRITLPEAPAEVNAELMTGTELRTKLQRGYEDIDAGRVQDAASAFVQHRKNR